MRWLGWFEVRGLIEEHPQLAVLGALGEAVLGHVATTERWAAAALAAAGGTDRVMPDGSALEGWLAVMEASLFRHGVARMRADAETARARLTPAELASRRPPCSSKRSRTTSTISRPRPTSASPTPSSALAS